MQDYLKVAGPEADEVEEASPVKASPPAGLEPKLHDPDAARKAASIISALGKETLCASTRARKRGSVLFCATIQRSANQL
jgi:PTS system glucose-specific IIC component